MDPMGIVESFIKISFVKLESTFRKFRDQD